MLQNMGKVLVFFGLILIVAGSFLFLAGKYTSLGRLPGDIVVRRENFTLYFPVTTCILISIILSFVFYFISKR